LGAGWSHSRIFKLIAMRCPSLAELPPPPPAKKGWPWTLESSRLPSQVCDEHSWPRITVITPSFNQGRFIEETIRSVLLQGYPDLEYLVLDGGSTDNSVEIIEKYSPWLTYWVSEPDSGQSDAINRGLHRASGLFATWINSDDMLCRNALIAQSTQVGFDGNTVYVGDCPYLDESGLWVSTRRGRVHCLEDLLRVKTVWRSGGNIVQPEVLFPLQLALSVGCLNPDNHCTMDYELWGKFFLAGAKFRYTGIEFGIFRQHSAQKTKEGLLQTDSLLGVARNLLSQAQGLTDEEKKEILAELAEYSNTYPLQYWRSSGRLARMGLPRGIVQPLRRMTVSLQRTAKTLLSSKKEI
jgi:hypothetical protein